MADQIDTIAGCLVQHGHHNRRAYVMHLDPEQAARLIIRLDGLARENGYGKIVAKVPATHWRPFESTGYTIEAVVPGLFKGKTDGLFVAKFFSEKRCNAGTRVWNDGGGSDSRCRRPAGQAAPPVLACAPEDASTLAGIYHRVFETYAFPIHRPGYLRRMMVRNALYFCIRIDHQTAAAAAAEVDFKAANCEMTDFATLPEYRGRGLAAKLLRRLDREARRRHLMTAYTIARADSRAMNRVFVGAGYRFAGQLVKNTQIGGRIRSMNVWYKNLRISGNR